MSRVHDALRRAEQTGYLQTPRDGGALADVPAPAPYTESPLLGNLLEQIIEVPFNPAPEAHLLDATKPHEAPSEEFRAFRTRINHLQSLQSLHSIVVTSPSPAEGKSFSAVNFALAEAHLAGNPTLLADFDFRRPVLHRMFQIDRGPGVTDYLQGKAPLASVIKKIAGSNLYLMPAGEAVINPLELLNLREVKQLLDELPRVFNWVILDSPPLLFAADANLLSTLTNGAVLVVRIGVTTIDSVTRAVQSMCENNLIGILVNGAERRELYSKYTYYHSYYYEARSGAEDQAEAEAQAPAGAPLPEQSPEARS
ncbi:MAG: CpsD/CapB family tyrosine-protein kinase [Acidobacteria bacterium]|nr:CpsD/CapB family tyrosine-protein kinase [Acidobacteriota bacterium]